MDKQQKKEMHKKKRLLNRNRKNSPVGGQAVMEGVMMKGPLSLAIAVRDADGIVRIESKRLDKKGKPAKVFRKIPIIRGIINFVEMMILGIKTLLRSAEVYGEEEPTKFEKWVAKKFKINLLSVVIGFSLIVSLLLAVGLFIIAPRFLTDLIIKSFAEPPHNVIKNLIDGGIRLSIFVAYILIVSLLKDIRRVFMYHGAEHRTINCYELGQELTVENVQSCSTVHQRCGTTFLFFVMIVSILVFSLLDMSTLLGWDNRWLNILFRIAMLPLVAGISYELLKLFAKTNSPLVYPLKAPGLLLQKLTTKKPTDDMAEVAIASFKAAMELENDKDAKEKVFVLPKKRKEYFEELKTKFNENNIDEADLEWIFADILKLKRSELNLRELVTVKEWQAIDIMADERIAGKPLQYILGSTEFYGYKIKTDKRALIPRLDTEILCEEAIKVIDKDKKVLDLCTGTGCIAIAINKETNADVTALDVSDEALKLAEENSELNNAKITIIKSDMFDALAEQKFDVIISNPPYIKSSDIEGLDKEIKDSEPSLALDGGDDGLAYYKIIAEKVSKYLACDGVLLLEIGYNQAQDVCVLFNNAKSVEVIKDLNGVDRVVKILF